MCSSFEGSWGVQLFGQGELFVGHFVQYIARGWPGLFEPVGAQPGALRHPWAVSLPESQRLVGLAESGLGSLAVGLRTV